MNKVVRDGKVAVLYSPGYGAGWSSWNPEHPECLFHPEIVALVEKLNAEYDELDEKHKKDSFTSRMAIDRNFEAEKERKVSELAKKLFGEDFYAGGANQLQIEWVEKGTRFLVDEYDGSEHLEILGPETGYVA